MASPVLLLMDYQEAICRPGGALGRAGSGAEAERRGVLAAAAHVLAAFRERDLPRIFVRVAFDEDYTRMTSASPRFQSLRKHRLLLESDPASAICAEVAPRHDEPVVTKGCVSPFVGTNLQSKLIALAAGELVLGGVATNQVVESTARTAADVGYPVTVLEDLCAGFDADSHAFSVERMLPVFGRVMDGNAYLEEL